MQTQQSRDIAAMWQAIDELDFERIKAKLQHRHHGAIAAEAIRRAEIGYRQFLKLIAKYPDVPVVPSEAVDEFWHMHILDTQRYGSDCERIFGYMVHHDPYLGIDGGEHEAQRQTLASASEALMMREFGQANEGIGATAAYCIKALDEMSSAAYCIRPLADESSAAYCIRPMAQATDAGYCIRALSPESSAAYCIRPMAKATDAGYCIRALSPESSAAYCIRPMAKATDAGYCIRPVAPADDKVLLS